MEWVHTQARAQEQGLGQGPNQWGLAEQASTVQVQEQEQGQERRLELKACRACKWGRDCTQWVAEVLLLLDKARSRVGQKPTNSPQGQRTRTQAVAS